MPRPVKGEVIFDACRKSPKFALRFYAYGKRQYLWLGTKGGGWTRAKAQTELENVLADVRRGIWRPTVEEVVEAPAEMSSFHEFASEWWDRNKDQLASNTQLDYSWRLDHPLPIFHAYALDAIDIDAVDRFVSLKLRGSLSPRSVNMMLTLLGSILEDGLERGLIASNPARGKRRRAKERTPARSYLENACQMEALLDAAGELDAEAPKGRRHVQRRAMIATLTFAGLRISELCTLRWRDVDLATDWLSVTGSKTDAATRKVKIRPALHAALLSATSPSAVDLNSFVFPTSAGKEMNPENFRNRVLAAATKRANANLTKSKLAPLPEPLTPHSMRRTFASVLYALGEDPGVVMTRARRQRFEGWLTEAAKAPESQT